jgi:hypothetical protein
MMQQVITPNPNIPCQPGWCLMYVRQTFGLPARYASATEAWENSASQHRDRNFPSGVWLPVWYGIDREPLGHVVLLAPDGSVYSTSDNSTIPHHHPNLADLEDFYAGWGWPLTYRGWTEDVAGYRVIEPGGSIHFDSGTITPIQSEEDDFMATPEQIQEFFDHQLTGPDGSKITLGEMILESRSGRTDIIRVTEGVAEEVLDTVVDGVAGDRITLRQFLAEYRAHIIQLAAGIAAEAAQGGASAEDIKKAVADGLSAGVKVTVTAGEAGSK